MSRLPYSVLMRTSPPKPGCRLIDRTLSWLSAFGLDPLTFLFAIRGFPRACREYAILRRQNRQTGAGWRMRFSRPCLHDRYLPGGTAGGHYFHQDLLVARRILQRRPLRHVDVGSRVDGFVAHVATFREIEVFDIRPVAAQVPNIIFRQCDLTHLPPDQEQCCDSLSCLHVLEHLGLGRYGDPVDIQGHLRGLDNLCRLLQPGGTLYLSFPIGPERIEFNGHRVFHLRTALDWFATRNLELLTFSYVDDAGALHENATRDATDIANDFGLAYGCGIFELRKP